MTFASGSGAVSSARPELPREFVASHKRQRMMDAIAELSAEKGYEATKIADIVRRAAVARKTLYDNFDGKEDLFLSAISSTMGEMRRAVESACEAADGDAEQGIVAGLEAALAYIAASLLCWLASVWLGYVMASRFNRSKEG